VSRSTGSYGGGPGENSEELVKELLQKAGWSVKELRKASDRGRAPMLEGSELRLVDFQVHNDGRRTRYVEVKSKEHAIEYGIKDEYRHGWEQASHDDYREFARQYTQDPVYVFVHERSSGVILRQRVRNLSPVQTMQDGDRLSAYNTSDPIVFFRRNEFDTVTDDVSQYLSGFGQTGIVDGDVDLSPFGEETNGQAGLSDFGGVGR
jgi:hypothetical protein